MELEYIQDIRNDVEDMIDSMIKHKEGFEVGVNRVIFENDYYMSDERPIERDCHYIAIGAYSVQINNADELKCNVLEEIKRSIDVIESGKYDNEFTEEDKKYIDEDIMKIEEYLKSK